MVRLHYFEPNRQKQYSQQTKFQIEIKDHKKNLKSQTSLQKPYKTFSMDQPKNKKRMSLHDWANLLFPIFNIIYLNDRDSTSTPIPCPLTHDTITRKGTLPILAAATREAKKRLPKMRQRLLQTARDFIVSNYSNQTGQKGRITPMVTLDPPGPTSEPLEPPRSETDRPISPPTTSRMTTLEPQPRIQTLTPRLHRGTPRSPKEHSMDSPQPRLTPLKINRNKDPSSFTTTTLHNHFGDKLQNWSLKPSKPFVIMGDSNLKRFPPIQHPLVQIDCYPGAKLKHAIHILRYKTPPCDMTEKVILSFGLNDRDITSGPLLENNLLKLIETATNTFPQAEIIFSLVHFSHKLPLEQQHNLSTLNHLILQKLPKSQIIPRIPLHLFQTTADLIHWSPETAKHILTKWLLHLN